MINTIRTDTQSARLKVNCITYDQTKTPQGILNIATTEFGLCKMHIGQNTADFCDNLQSEFPNATMTQKSLPNPLKTENTLDLYGTEFQFKVWKALLDIPAGLTTTYAAIAQKIGHPKAVRAVGTAIGKNPIAILIPCHRVLRTDGGIGGYAWGANIKENLLKSEAA